MIYLPLISDWQASLLTILVAILGILLLVPTAVVLSSAIMFALVSLVRLRLDPASPVHPQQAQGHLQHKRGSYPHVSLSHQKTLLSLLTALPGTKYYKAVDGDSCEIISNKFGTFTVAQFETWNPAVGTDCSKLFLGYYYCIAISGKFRVARIQHR